MENNTTTLEVKGQTFTVETRQEMYDTNWWIRQDGKFVAVALKEEWIERLCTEHVLYGNWTEKVNCRFD